MPGENDGLAGAGFDAEAVPVEGIAEHQEQLQQGQEEPFEPASREQDDGSVGDESFLFCDEYQKGPQQEGDKPPQEGEPKPSDMITRNQLNDVLAEQAQRSQEQATQMQNHFQDMLNKQQEYFMGLVGQMARQRQAAPTQPKQGSNLIPTPEELANMDSDQFARHWQDYHKNMQEGFQNEMRRVVNAFGKEINTLKQANSKQAEYDSHMTTIMGQEEVMLKQFPAIAKDPELVKLYRSQVANQYQASGGDPNRVNYQAAAEFTNKFVARRAGEATSQLPPGAKVRQPPGNLKGSGSMPIPKEYDFRKLSGPEDMDSEEFTNALLGIGPPGVSGGRRR